MEGYTVIDSNVSYLINILQANKGVQCLEEHFQNYISVLDSNEIDMTQKKIIVILITRNIIEEFSSLKLQEVEYSQMVDLLNLIIKALKIHGKYKRFSNFYNTINNSWIVISRCRYIYVYYLNRILQNLAVDLIPSIFRAFPNRFTELTRINNKFISQINSENSGHNHENTKSFTCPDNVTVPREPRLLDILTIIKFAKKLQLGFLGVRFVQIVIKTVTQRMKKILDFLSKYKLQESNIYLFSQLYSLISTVQVFLSLTYQPLDKNRFSDIIQELAVLVVSLRIEQFEEIIKLFPTSKLTIDDYLIALKFTKNLSKFTDKIVVFLEEKLLQKIKTIVDKGLLNTTKNITSTIRILNIIGCCLNFNKNTIPLEFSQLPELHQLCSKSYEVCKDSTSINYKSELSKSNVYFIYHPSIPEENIDIFNNEIVAVIKKNPNFNKSQINFVNIKHDQEVDQDNILEWWIAACGGIKQFNEKSITTLARALLKPVNNPKEYQSMLSNTLVGWNSIKVKLEHNNILSSNLMMMDCLDTKVENLDKLNNFYANRNSDGSIPYLSYLLITSSHWPFSFIFEDNIDIIVDKLPKVLKTSHESCIQYFKEEFPEKITKLCPFSSMCCLTIDSQTIQCTLFETAIILYIDEHSPVRYKISELESSFLSSSIVKQTTQHLIQQNILYLDDENNLRLTIAKSDLSTNLTSQIQCVTQSERFPVVQGENNCDVTRKTAKSFLDPKIANFILELIRERAKNINSLPYPTNKQDPAMPPSLLLSKLNSTRDQQKCTKLTFAECIGFLQQMEAAGLLISVSGNWIEATRSTL